MKYEELSLGLFVPFPSLPFPTSPLLRISDPSNGRGSGREKERESLYRVFPSRGSYYWPQAPLLSLPGGEPEANRSTCKGKTRPRESQII
jgi:hypothetical protein